VKARVLAGLISSVLTPLIPVACNDSTGPTTLVWSSVSSGTTERLTGVWGASASDVWAVGYGTILHYNGTAWSSVAIPATGAASFLLSVWGSSASDVWAVGYETTNFTPTILHYNGTTWSTVSSGVTQLLTSVWGTSASDVWVVGVVGTILHYDGSSWTVLLPTGAAGTTNFFGAWGSSPSNMWFVSSTGTNGPGAGQIHHYNGTTLSSVLSGTTPGLFGIWGSSASDVWAVGDGGTILHGSLAR
jgi:hypothetical protein